MRPSHGLQSHAINVLLAWSLLALGGVYLWALLPIAIGSVLLLVMARPPVPAQRDRLLDWALIAILCVIALQLVPLPRVVLGLLAPRTAALTNALTLGAPASWGTLTVWRSGTVEALLVVASAVAVFWTARELFSYQGIRRAIRTVALCGAAASFAGLLQRKTGSNLLYGLWHPVETGAFPFGPFVNRNYFATWVLMAIPLCAGYWLARRHSHVRRDFRPWRVRLASALDGRAIWLMTVVGLMTVALFASLSRSGTIGLAAVLVMGWAGALGRPRSRRLSWAVLALIVIAFTVLLWGDVPALVGRFDNASALEPRNRTAIWRDTSALIRNHWLFGVGAGAYERAMFFYQTTDRTYYDNQAHNQFLQIAAEGGLLLAVPAVAALGVVLVSGSRRLRADRTGMFWIRLGALSGLAGVVVQGFWETGLRAPGNGILSAVVAAILLHEPIAPVDRPPGQDGEPQNRH